MSLLIINLGMLISLICFYTGFFYRKKNRTIHKNLGLTGLGISLLSALYLLTGKYLGGGISSMGIVSSFPKEIILTHRIFAGAAFLLMLGMGYTGITGKRDLHIRMHYIFLPLYTVVYISGCIIFSTRQTG